MKEASKPFFFTKKNCLLLYTSGGLAIGVSAAAFAWLSDLAQDGFVSLNHRAPLISLLITPAGFAVSVYATRHWCPASAGTGFPQAMAAQMPGRERLASLRATIFRVMLTLLGQLCGGSFGRKGPTVHIGASVLAALGRISRQSPPGLVLVGAAAGVAAAFSSPLAGLAFLIEEIVRGAELRLTGPMLAGVIAAGLVSQALIGDGEHVGAAARQAMEQPWLAALLCGIAGGLAGGIFTRLVVLAATGRHRLWVELKRHPLAFAGGCGLIVALAGIASGGTIHGSGTAQMVSMLSGTPQPQSFGALKLLATLVSTASGTAGGIFTPSLAVGAGIGANLGLLLPQMPLGAMALLGMAGYFAGVVQAPIMSFVIVAELSDSHALAVPLILACLLGWGISRLVSRQGIYHALAQAFISAGP